MTNTLTHTFDTSGSMPRNRDFIVGDVHGGTDFAPVLAAFDMAVKYHQQTKPTLLFVTDGDLRSFRKVTRARKAHYRVRQYAQQLRHRGTRKMRARRTVLKSTARCDG